MSGGAELLRATILHTPRNPFSEDNSLESYADGALAIAGGRVLAIGDYAGFAPRIPMPWSRTGVAR